MDRKYDRCDEPVNKKNKRKESPVMSNDSCQITVDNSQIVLDTLAQLYSERQMCDLVLKVGHRAHHAHRLILCASSDVFHAMFTHSEWKESHNSEITLEELPVCEAVFHLFLEYFYTGRILITHTNVMPILALADKYIVKSLSRICVEYMCKHISHAASHNQLFLWLQYSVPCGHAQVAEKCTNFIKWNLEAIANSSDFSNIEPEILVRILRQNDVVIYNEMVLFNCVLQWLTLHRIKMAAELAAPDLDHYMYQLTEDVMAHIKFPMLSPRELADLVLLPVIKQHKEFFFDRMRTAMAYHRNRDAQETREICGDTLTDDFLFTPRLYTADTFSTSLTIENLNSLPFYHVSTFVFSTHFSSADCESDRMIDWMVDLYPRGIWIKKCLLIVWQGTLEVPEEIVQTVRLALTCREPPKAKMRVKVAVLIYGMQGGVEHVMEIREKIHHFTPEEKIMNIDNLIPFAELNPTTSGGGGGEVSAAPSVYLTGVVRNKLKLNLVITTLS